MTNVCLACISIPTVTRVPVQGGSNKDINQAQGVQQYRQKLGGAPCWALTATLQTGFRVAVATPKWKLPDLFSNTAYTRPEGHIDIIY